MLAATPFVPPDIRPDGIRFEARLSQGPKQSQWLRLIPKSLITRLKVTRYIRVIDVNYATTLEVSVFKYGANV